MKPSCFPFLIALVLCATAPISRAQVPPTLHYQARITSEGQTIGSGTEVAFAFQLIAPDDFPVLWRSYPDNLEDPVDGLEFDIKYLLPVELRNGQISVRLGSGYVPKTDDPDPPKLNEPIPATGVFTDPATGGIRPGVKLRAWMSVDGGRLIQMKPDIEFASVPYAMTAGFSETVRDRSITTHKLEDGAVVPAKISPDAVGSSAIAPGSIDTTKIASGGVELHNLSDLARNHLAPPGGMMAYGGSTDPDGWLICDGREVSRTTYPALFLAIGTTYGPGDGENTFNLPNARGLVLRGTGTRTVNNRAKVGPALGAVQEDQMQRFHGWKVG